MPKLKHQPPKYCKIKIKKKLYAVVYHHGKIIYLGAYGSPESKIAYTRFIAEHKDNTSLYLPEDNENVTVKQLALSFLDHVERTITPQGFGHLRSAIKELMKLYGDDTQVGDFTPSCLKLYRKELINSGRLCRRTINDRVRRIVAMFTWGVSEELVKPDTETALKSVKPLSAGYPETFDHPEREDVPDNIIIRTLPFMVPTIKTMVKLQRLTGMRPSEIFNMRVGEIDKKTDPELWLYKPPKHKTLKKTGQKKIVPLSKIEQKLIAPYLKNKKPDAAVFSLHTAKLERKASNLPCVRFSSKNTEFFDKDSYRREIEFAIKQANKTLPDKEKIPHWTPYQLRHSASSAMEIEEDGIDKAQILLGHTSPNTTARYNHRQLQKAKEMARNRKDIFAEE
jgi:integrase